MIFFQLILLFIAFTGLISITPSKIHWILSTLFGLIWTSQFSTALLTGNFIDDRMLAHTSIPDIISVSAFFTNELIIALLTWLIISLMLGLSSRWASKNPRCTSPWNFSVAILATALLFIPRGMGTTFINTTFSQAQRVGFSNALEENGISPASYTFSDQVKATPGKNVIVIYLESLERGFLNDHNTIFTPNLQQLSSDYNYYEMTPGPGSNWSAASFYTGICGLPAFFSFGSNGNTLFQKTKSQELTGVGHVFNAAGYDPIFMLGNKSFAGLDDMLTAQGFRVKSEVDFTTQYDKVPWGIHDRDLFSEAKKEILSRKESNKPFALYMATIGSHAPDGLYDKRIEKEINVKGSNLEKMIAATDREVANLIHLLKTEDLLTNTVFYIMPDHLMLGNGIIETQQFEKERSLYVITNADLPIDPKAPIQQIELPRLTLEGANIKHNASFLSDYIPKPITEDSILNRKKQIQLLNENSIHGANLISGFKLKLSADSILLLSEFVNKSFQIPSDNSNVLMIQLDHKFRLITSTTMSLYESIHRKRPQSQPALIIQTTNNTLYATIHYGKQKFVTKSNSQEIQFSKEDILLARNWPYEEDLYQLPQFKTYNSPDARIVITSTVYPNAQIKTPSEFIVKHKTYSIQKEGIYTFTNDELTHYDPNLDQDISKFIANLKSKDHSLITFAHGNAIGRFNHKLSSQGYEKLSQLKENQAYISYYHNGILCEHTQKSTLSLNLPILSSYTSEINNEITENLAERLIAHAGGAINGQIYTNSLESLEYAYAKGFRNFELDIIKTSDGKYVAAHDWIKWHQITNTPGGQPVTLNEFVSKKLHNKHTPLDMVAINQWFEEHPDAYLVTDKIDEPWAFSRAFTDPNRLTMELFTWTQFYEAQKIKGITPMPTEKLIYQIEGDKLTFLKSNKVTHIAVSQRSVFENPEFYKSLKQAGIKINVYHLNAKDQKNEVLVIQELNTIIYGLYADYWPRFN